MQTALELIADRRLIHLNFELCRQGSDGMECVLKTLCETGQRDTNEKPGSMIVELLRAVFT